MFKPAKKFASDDEVKIFIKKKFDTWIIQSIEQTLVATRDPSGNKTSPLVAYLLLSCAIDIIAGFYGGRDTDTPPPGAIGKQYKDFVKAYMPSYDENELYTDLRCKLTHNFTLGKTLNLTNGKPDSHGLKDGDGREIKNFENVLNDFKAGVNKYFEDLLTKKELQENFKKRVSGLGFVDMF
ncbi:MAG: hypothetical protein A2570_03760 [Candidatus Brennerbacteria bacterium RIFOXYD1_FULL_41_16]|uniref:Uncharacterized protein n=1 Tax=Candidatus Brennerbacteria bacterium RIFOXYD1_FULL_41_16 TaxID=1797529 RepID=A0A1G1XKE0_9BACT|nr:MAG: hypothetical protein A2570_03760 [Candidatus Brennerbacteria bacterium RIFOXYD1_FULL_41_16]